MNTVSIVRRASSRVPTAEGVFHVYLFSGSDDDKEHIALVRGNVAGREEVPVRLHSECFTGDVLGSRRCDCGEQLRNALHIIAAEPAGVLIYLRQEGRGIGLASKLMAYNLQDIGYDTVDANLLLGFRADERDYSVAALILQDLGVRSIRLLTNNPAKIKGLRERGITVTCRLPLEGRVYPENRQYLLTKARRMNHLLQFGAFASEAVDSPGPAAATDERAEREMPVRQDRPFVTVSYAQSIDGSISTSDGGKLLLSGPESLKFIHRLRASHHAILVGIRTVIADDPCLTVRHVRGDHPQPVVVDTSLRFPESAYLLRDHPRKPWIAVGENADADRIRRLEAQGARILRTRLNGKGRLDLGHLLHLLAECGIRRLMVEGGARIITSFLGERLVDRMAVTVAPLFVGGIPAVSGGDRARGRLPRLENTLYRYLGNDIVIQGRPVWEEQ